MVSGLTYTGEYSRTQCYFTDRQKKQNIIICQHGLTEFSSFSLISHTYHRCGASFRFFHHQNWSTIRFPINYSNTRAIISSRFCRQFLTKYLPNLASMDDQAKFLTKYFPSQSPDLILICVPLSKSHMPRLQDYPNALIIKDGIRQKALSVR